MKKLLLASVISLSATNIALAESAFSYDAFLIGYSSTSSEIDELDVNLTSHGLGLMLTRELENQLFISMSAGAGKVDENFTYSGVQFNTQVEQQMISLALGRYFVVDEKTDFYASLGIYRSSYDLTTTGRNPTTGVTARFEDDDSDVGIDLNLGLRLFVDQANKFEVSPSFEISSYNGESDRNVAVDVGYYVSPKAQLIGGVSKYLDQDAHSVGIGLRIYL